VVINESVEDGVPPPIECGIGLRPPVRFARRGRAFRSKSPDARWPARKPIGRLSAAIPHAVIAEN